MCGCHAPKQDFIAMACNCKLHAILWRVIGMKRNIGSEITGLEMMTMNCVKIWHVSKPMELMFKGELHCLQGGRKRKQTGREDV